MRRIANILTYLISYLIPINKKLLVFVSGFDYSDNPYAVYRYLLEHGMHNDYIFCWLVKDVVRSETNIKSDLKTLGCPAKVFCLKRKSLKSIYLSFRARYIFNTTGLYRFITYHQKDKRINMWHGMPIKRIFTEGRNGDITIATSDMFAPLMSRGLNIPLNNVWIVGQPRNDLMFRKDLAQFSFLNRNYKTVGIWMPTFRRTLVDNYQDGNYTDGYISFVKINELKDLNDILVNNNSLLIIKLHPLDVLQNKEIPSLSNIIVYKNNNFHNKDLYPLLGVCDYMLTDYSSVAIDYEILRKPIGFTLDNIEEYGKTRGLSIDTLPGKSLYTYDEMKSFILNAINKEMEVTDFGTTYNLFRDSNSSYRLLSKLNIIK